MARGLPFLPGARRGLDPDFLRHGTPERFGTPRLWLEKIHVDHAGALRDSVLRSQPELQFVDWARGAWTPEHARRFCRSSREAMDREGRFLTYLVFERMARSPEVSVAGRGAYVGLLDLHQFDFAVPRCQIGYVSHRDRSDVRRPPGLMKEAALALLDHAFAWGLLRIEVWCDARNARSVRFAQALGFQREGLMRSVARDADGQLCDQWLLARLAADPPPA